MLHVEKLCKERTSPVNFLSGSEAEMWRGGGNSVFQRCKHTLPTFTSSSGGILKALESARESIPVSARCVSFTSFTFM